MTYYIVRAHRGKNTDTILVHGNIEAWLLDRKARKTKAGWNVHGWRCTIAGPYDQGQVDMVDWVTGKGSPGNGA